MNGIKYLENQTPNVRWEGGERRCRKCGKIVCSYKSPQSTTPLCYACEDAGPWTYTNIVGRAQGVGNE